ncbi:MAG: hypothetical protein ACYSX0_03850 [Planctomycetota bacterium]|jgi:hypothetical protein
MKPEDRNRATHRRWFAPVAIAALFFAPLNGACTATAPNLIRDAPILTVPAADEGSTSQPTASVNRSSPHTLNVLAGGSVNRAGDGFTLGANYEYRQRGKVGIGGFGDVTFGDRTTTALGGAGYFHPAERWVVMAGPGVEFEGSSSKVMVRVGGWYEFPMDKFRLAPAAFVDLGLGDPVLFVALSAGWDF